MSRRSRSKSRRLAGAPTEATTSRAAARPASRARTPQPAPALPPTHPAFVFAMLVAAASVLVSISYRLHDTDLWQLLVVGKAMWARHAIPRTDEWTWAGHGDPQVTSSWGFRALIWPLWARFGVGGLFAYRWGVTLLAFALMAIAARRMGARGFVPLAVVALGGLAYRLRAEVRPESLAAVLVALEVAILEGWRNGGRDRRGWIAAIALVWANVHITYWVLLLLLAIYGVDAIAARRPRAAPAFAALGLACIAASLANPFGWRALIQPFEFALRWRHEPMFRNVVELLPVNWQAHRTDGLPVLVALWPLLLMWRWRRSGPDVAGMLCCAAFTWLGLSSQRFLGLYVLVAVPFVARDLQAVVESVRWPAWCARSWARAGLAAAACAGIGIAEWSRPELPLGIGLEPSLYPAAACDFMERHGVRGRMFNHFHLGGYITYRGWPRRDRLPFVTTQPENIRPAIRALYPRVFVDASAWRALDAQYRFEIAVLNREQDPGDRLLDFLDADSTWTMVFADDAAEVLVRRTGPLAAVADRFGYRVLPAGIVRRMQVVPAAARDSAYRALARAELERMEAGSPEDGGAHHMLGIFAMMDGRLDDARRHLERALAKKPFLPKVHELLGIVALEQSRPRDALAEFERERSLQGEPEGIDVRIGSAYEALGDLRAARRAYDRELRLHPANAEAQAARARLRSP